MLYNKKLYLLPLSLLIGTNSIAFAKSEIDLDKFLNDFHKNPSKTMEIIPEKETKSENSQENPNFPKQK